MAVLAEVLALASGVLKEPRRKSGRSFAQGDTDCVGADENTESQCQEGIAWLELLIPGWTRLVLGPHLSASPTSVIPVAVLGGGAKLYGEAM